jgi:hypothetical protein
VVGCPSQARRPGGVIPGADRRGAGVQAPPGPVVDRRGEPLVATGNDSCSTVYDQGNSVLRLTADLRQQVTAVSMG